MCNASEKFVKEISIAVKLDIVSQLKKVNKLLTCDNVRFTNIIVHTILANADRITESAKSGTKVSV